MCRNQREHTCSTSSQCASQGHVVSLRLVDQNCVIEPKLFADGVMSGRTLLNGNTFRSVNPVMNLADSDYEIYQGANFGDTKSVEADEIQVASDSAHVSSKAGHVPVDCQSEQFHYTESFSRTNCAKQRSEMPKFS